MQIGRKQGSNANDGLWAEGRPPWSYILFKAIFIWVKSFREHAEGINFVKHLLYWIIDIFLEGWGETVEILCYLVGLDAVVEVIKDDCHLAGNFDWHVVEVGSVITVYQYPL